MEAGRADRSSVPWPTWMFRYVAANNESAYEDLIWSVGGSPPYGGVPYDEAEAVYKLLEAHRGPGAVPDEYFEAVRSLAVARPGALEAIQAFESFDRIASSPDSYQVEETERGLAAASSAGHRGAIAAFSILKAQSLLARGEVDEPIRLNLDALAAFVELAAQDGVYVDRAAAIAQNSVAYLANAGRIDEARDVFSTVEHLIPEPARGQIKGMLA